MTRTAARNFIVRSMWMPCALAVMLASPELMRADIPAPTRDLLAQGTEQQLWCADVIPPPPGAGPNAPSALTVIRFRAFGESQWRMLGQIAAPAIDLDNRGSELLIVLASGEWRIISTDGQGRSGVDLPRSVRMLAIAGGDEEDIWAIGAAPEGHLLSESASAAATSSPSSTAPATIPVHSVAASTTQAASRPSFPPHELGLFHLLHGAWSETEPLPASIARADVLAASLDVIEHRVMLAIATRSGDLRVYTHTGAGWSEGRHIAAFSPGDRMKLTDFEGRPILWLSDARGPGSIYLGDGGSKWSAAVALTPPTNLSGFDRTALVVALGRLRLIESDGKGRLAEQNYNLDGTLSGAPTEAATAPVPLDTRLAEAVQMIIMAVLLVWVIGAMRQRPAVQDAIRKIDRAALAPHGRRLAGGIIDALPVIIAFIVSGEMLQSEAQSLSTHLTLTSPEIAISALGIAVYLLHTTISELIFARSIGKFATGTRVVSITNGARPVPSAILIRNLLRLVDVFMIFPPIFVIFSPLRQRVGDMAAGTIVIRNSAEPMTQTPDQRAQ